MSCLHLTHPQSGTKIKVISTAPINWQGADAEIPQVWFFRGVTLQNSLANGCCCWDGFFLSDSLHIWKGAAAVPGCSAVPKHRCWSPKQSTCAITTEAPAARMQRCADTAMLLWGPKRSGSALAMGFAFRRIDVVLNGDTVFYLSRFFQLVRCISANYR